MLRGNAERRIRRAVAVIAFAPFNDLEEKAIAVIRTEKLEVFSGVIAIIEDTGRPKPIAECRIEIEPGSVVVVVVVGNDKRSKAAARQSFRGNEDVPSGGCDWLQCCSESFRGELPR
jgi:hypothetical protein